MTNSFVSEEKTINAYKKGIANVVNAVKPTIGPKGRNISLMVRGELVIANDAQTIAQAINPKDQSLIHGTTLAKNTISKTSTAVGGGRTATAILLQAIFEEGLSYIEKGRNVNEIRRGITDATKDIQKNLKKLAKPISSEEQLKQVATISTESKELGSLIGEVVYKVGKNGVVTVEESDSFSSEYTDGIEFDKGFIHPYLANTDQGRVEYSNVPILVSEKKISSFKDIVPVLKRLASSGIKDLVVIADDIDGDALTHIVLNKVQGMFNIVAIKLPGFGETKKEWIEDIASSVGATVVSDMTGVSYETVMLGSVRKIISTKEKTVLVGADTTSQVKKLTELLENATDIEQERLNRRIAVLSNGVAVIKVGASTEEDLKYIKLKADDGINEAKRALEEGIIPGGDIGYVWASKKLLKRTVDDYSVGYNVVVRAVEAPLRNIVLNANGKPDIVVHEVRKGYAYDAVTNKTFKGDRGIYDAVKVATVALEHASSSASMALTLGGSLVDDEKEN